MIMLIQKKVSIGSKIIPARRKGKRKFTKE